MEGIKATAMDYWKKTEECFKAITPKHEIVKKVEEKTKLAGHYWMMIICALLLIIFGILTRKVFSTVIIIIPATIVFFMDLSKQENTKKWCCFWMFYSLLITFAKLFARIPYFAVVKVAICYYFAFFDKENYLVRGFEYIPELVHMAMEKCPCGKCQCAEKTEVTEKTD